MKDWLLKSKKLLWWYISLKGGKVTRKKISEEKKEIIRTKGKVELKSYEYQQTAQEKKNKTKENKKRKKKKTAEYCHIAVHIISPNNTLEIVLSWGGCSFLRLIFLMYFLSHIQ